MGISSADVSIKSAPAQKPGPEPLSTITLMETSFSILFNICKNLFLNSPFNELYCFGLDKRILATPSKTLNSITFSTHIFLSNYLELVV